MGNLCDVCCFFQKQNSSSMFSIRTLHLLWSVKNSTGCPTSRRYGINVPCGERACLRLTINTRSEEPVPSGAEGSDLAAAGRSGAEGETTISYESTSGPEGAAPLRTPKPVKSFYSQPY